MTGRSSALAQLSDAALQTRFTAAHVANDVAALAQLFAEAARRAGSEAAERFMLTQAHALGLEAGLPEAAAWHRRLAALGAEAPATCDAVGEPGRQPRASAAR